MSVGKGVMKMSWGKVGFARSGVEGTYTPLLANAVDDSLEAIAMYLDVQGERLLFVALDFSQFARCYCTEIRERMSTQLDISPEAIVFHSTHNHTGPTNEDYVLHRFPLDNLIACLVQVSREAIMAAKPARMAFAVADVGNQFSLCRRKWINDDIANITNWYGYKNDMPRGSTANHLIRDRLRRWFGPNFGEPQWLSEPIYYDNPVDTLVQLVEFTDQNDNPLGGMIRFAAHPHLLLAAEPTTYGTDYCGPARRWLDNKRGGIHLFAEGPQCNLVPRETFECVPNPAKLNWADSPYGPDGSLVAVDSDQLRHEVRKMGEGLAFHVYKALQQAEFKPLQLLEVKTRWHELPMKADVPENSEIAWSIRDEYVRKIKQALRDGVSIIQMKRLTDQYNRFHWMKKMLDEWYMPSSDEIARKCLPVHLQAVHLNEIAIAGLPAETGLETSLWLRAHTIGNRLVTVQQCNGDIGYLISGQDQRGGDYEAMCSLIASDGLDVLHAGAMELLTQLNL